MKIFESTLVLLAGIACGSLTIAAHATPLDLKGTKVSSTLTVTGSPSFSDNTFSTTPFTIATGKEYSADTAVTSGMTTGRNPKAYTYTDNYKANFTKTDLIIRDTCTDTGANGCSHDPFAGFTMVFTDRAFRNATLTVVSDPAGYTYSLSRNVLTVTYAGGSAPSDKFDLQITPLVVPTPEPGGLALLATGMASLVAAGRRKFLA